MDLFIGWDTTLYRIVFTMGLFSTMPVVTIPLGSTDIAIFRILFYGFLFYMFIKAFAGRLLIIRREQSLLCLWLIIAIISGLVGWIALSSSHVQFSSAAKSNILKTGAFLVFIALWGSQEPEMQRKMNEALIKGLMLGCILNVSWAIIDAGGYYLTGRSLNNIIFFGYIARHGIRYNSLSLAYSNTGMIRAGGFNYDPAQLGFMVPVITSYAVIKRKYWLLLLAFGGIIASASTTALVCSLIVLVVNLAIKKERVRISRKTVVTGICTLLLAGLILSKYGEVVFRLITSAISKMTMRLSTTYLNNDILDIRWDYLIMAPKAFLNLGIFMLTGLGFGTSSYGYVIDSSILARIGSAHNFAYDLENTYICYLMDTGIIGFIVYILVLCRVYAFYKQAISASSVSNENVLIYCGIGASIFSMLFYHYILFAPQMLFLIVALSNMDLTGSYNDALKKGSI